ncbi:MAG: hypothetical protein ACSHXY_06010 [Alphaproteobacteria bacterium]
MQKIIETLEEICLQDHAKGSAGITGILTAEVLLLAEQVCVERDRLVIGMRLIQQGRDVTQDNVNAFELEDSDIEVQLARHTEFYEETFKRLSDAIDAI